MTNLPSKSEIRKYFLSLRERFVESLKDDNILLAAQVVDYLSHLRPGMNVGVYSPFKSELDISLISEHLKQNHSVSLPKIIDEDKMHFFNCQTKAPIIPEILIVPSVTCDKYMNRIGYGKGYYDKYLESHRSVYKIAILPEQLVYSGQIPSEEHDIKMDLLITNKATYRGTHH